MNEFHFEEDTFFECQNSGLCCRTDWIIPVEKTKADRLAELGPKLALAKTPGGTYRLNKVGSRCGFLTDTDHCRVHGEIGPEHKPLTCQVFPYTFTPTPDGTLVGLSHYCPSVRARIGTALSEQSHSVEPLLEQLNLPSRTSGIVTLIGDQTIGWTGYCEIEKKISELLESYPPAEVFWGAHLGFTENPKTWSRMDLDQLLTLPNSLQELDGPLRNLATLLKLELHSQINLVEENQKAYFRSLVRRKFLTKFGSITDNLATLAVCALLLRWVRDPDECIQVLELHLTHGSGFPIDLFKS